MLKIPTQYFILTKASNVRVHLLSLIYVISLAPFLTLNKMECGELGLFDWCRGRGRGSGRDRATCSEDSENRSGSGSFRVQYRLSDVSQISV